MAILSFFQTIGFMLGPAIQSALTPLGCSENYDSGTFHLDMYTITGWLSAAVGCITLATFVPGFFSEHYIATTAGTKVQQQGDERVGGAEEQSPDKFALISLIFEPMSAMLASFLMDMKLAVCGDMYWSWPAVRLVHWRAVKSLTAWPVRPSMAWLGMLASCSGDRVATIQPMLSTSAVLHV